MEFNPCASPKLNSLIEQLIVEYVEVWSRSYKYDKHDWKLSFCLSHVYAELSKATKDRTKWGENDLFHIDKFLTLIRDEPDTQHPLYSKIQRSQTWITFAQERTKERKEIELDAKRQKIVMRTPLKRRRFSDIREEVTNGNVFDEASVVKSTRIFTEQQRISRKERSTKSTTTPTTTTTTGTFATASLDGLKDSRNGRLANITDAFIGTKLARRKVKQWLKRNSIVAVNMRKLSWLTHTGSTALGNSLKARFMALLDMLNGTEVFAANFGENPDIADCHPFECLIDHIVNDHGPIRRYFVCDTIFSREVRIASGFPSTVKQIAKAERESKRGVWIEHANDNVAWDAVAKSNCSMGSLFVTKRIAVNALK
mmetsp:Transcript_15694/g.26321  ORF Transcript_15694/g.26321 Transcript_15694/m.26321 type:complete len:369 (+) Transcript_15694:72-1178(+)